MSDYERRNLQRQLDTARATERHTSRQIKLVTKQRGKAKDPGARRRLGAELDVLYSRLNEAQTLIESCRARLAQIDRSNGGGRR